MEQDASTVASTAEIFDALRKLRMKRGISLEKLESTPALLSLKSVQRQAESEGRTDALHEVAYEVLECFLRTEVRNLEAAQRTVYVELNFERRQDWVGDREGAVAYELSIQQNYEGHSRSSYEAVAVALRNLEVSPCATDEPAKDLVNAKLVNDQADVLMDVITRALIGLALLKGRDPETRESIEEILRQHLSNARRVATQLGADFWPDTSDETEVLRGIVHKVLSGRYFALSRRQYNQNNSEFQMHLSARQIESALFPRQVPALAEDASFTRERGQIDRGLTILARVAAVYEIEDRWIEVLLDDDVHDRVSS